MIAHTSPRHHEHGDMDLQVQQQQAEQQKRDKWNKKRERMKNEFRTIVKIFQQVVRTVMVVLQPVLVTLAICLIGFVVYAYFFHLLPIYTKGTTWVGHVASFLFMTCPGLFLLYGILLNYFMVVLTPAGFANSIQPKIPLPSFCDEHGRDQNRVKVYCVQCKIMKPARSHHCSICNKCVLVRAFFAC
jgi:hypothetical protein